MRAGIFSLRKIPASDWDNGTVQRKEPAFVYFSVLPPELKLYVLSFLDDLSLLNATLACKEWAVITSDDMVWRQRILSNWTIPKEWGALTNKQAADWKKIYFNTRKYWGTNDDSKQALAKVKEDFQTAQGFIHDPTEYNKFYRVSFERVMRDQRVAAIGTIAQLWVILLKDRCKFLDLFVAFLMENKRQIVSYDTYSLFLEFCEEYNSDLTFSCYNVEDSWPALFDDFVVYVKLHMYGKSALTESELKVLDFMSCPLYRHLFQ